MRPRRPPTPVLRWKFDDGSTETMTLEEFERQRAAEARRMLELLKAEAEANAATKRQRSDAGRASAEARKPEPAHDWWQKIADAAAAMRAAGRTDSDIADKLRRKAGRGVEAVRKRIAKELGPRRK